MGKAILIFLLGSMAIFDVINLTNNQKIKSALNTSVSYYSDAQARNIGNSTMQMILSQLADSSSWRVSNSSPISLNLLNGSAKYYIKDTAVASDSLVKVNVYANYRGTLKTIIAYLKPIQGTPSFLNYALLTGGNLTITGNFNVTSPTGVNANVFSNGSTTITGSGSVAGFVNYTNNLTTTGFDKSKIIPPLNPNSLPAYAQAAAVPIPTFDPNYFKNIAVKTYAPGTSLTGVTIPLGTKAFPTIIYSNGDLTLTGVTFTGYGAICVNGNLTLTGNNKSLTNDPTGSPLALYVVGNTTATGNSDFNLFAMGGFTQTGALTIKGSLIAKNATTLTGGINIAYYPAVPTILPASWTLSSRPSDIRYYFE
jgi:hypothetical protein